MCCGWHFGTVALRCIGKLPAPGNAWRAPSPQPEWVRLSSMLEFTGSSCHVQGFWTSSRKNVAGESWAGGLVRPWTDAGKLDAPTSGANPVTRLVLSQIV